MAEMGQPCSTSFFLIFLVGFFIFAPAFNGIVRTVKLICELGRWRKNCSSSRFVNSFFVLSFKRHFDDVILYIYFVLSEIFDQVKTIFSFIRGLERKPLMERRLHF